MRQFGLFLIIALTALMASCSGHESSCGVKVVALPDSLWNVSSWISARNAPVMTDTVHTSYNCRAADGSSWFVSHPVNAKKVMSAKWMTTGLGTYELFVNGQRVGKEVLKPGFTSAEKTKRSFTYDITAAWDKKQGHDNQLSAELTPGWWADKIITPGGHVGMVGKKCAFRGLLELVYADGSRECFGTDTLHWIAGVAGPVTHAAIFDGESYDARILPGYLTEEKLLAPERNDEFHGEILPSEGAEVYRREDLALPPVKAYVWEGVSGQSKEEFGTVIVKRAIEDWPGAVLEPGETLVVDFGQNAAAVPSFRFSAEEGTVLTCLPSEILNDGNGALSRGMDGPEGSVHRRNLRVPDQGFSLQYTFAGMRGWESYSPRHTFFGYRYLSITASSRICFKSIESVPVTSISKYLETGTLVTGNELINRLISNTVWGQRSNYLSVPTDCPQRNERLGWTADTQVFCETGSFFANTASFFHKWMRDMRDSQSQAGGFPGVAPAAQYGNETMRIGWADAAVIVPWTVWKQFGDTSIIQENWEALEKFISLVDRTRYNHIALVDENRGYQYADWLSYEPLESHSRKIYDQGTGKLLPEAVQYWNYLGACYWLLDAGMMRDMAVATGRDASVWEAMAARALDYLKAEFLTPEGTFKEPILNMMQTPALFALKTGLVEGSHKEAMIARLRANFQSHGNCLQTGFLGTSILMSTLTEIGMADIAWDLLFQRRNPSWLYSVDNGATTIWERWNSYTIESGMGPRRMNSFNHYAYGCVCLWLWETAAGISADTSAPGFRHVIMKPMPDRRLGSLDARFHSPAGPISSCWRYEGDEWVWNFTIPDGASASVTLPGESESEDYGPGTYCISRNLPLVPADAGYASEARVHTCFSASFSSAGAG